MRTVVYAALAMAHLSSFAAGDQASCERLLNTASDQEVSARRAYLLATPSEAVAPMERAAGAFEKFASQCGVEPPLGYAGVLIHGRLAILYRKLGKVAASQQSANLAIKYGSLGAKRPPLWPELEQVVVEADAKQRQSIK
jgi:hypothetical protein